MQGFSKKSRTKKVLGAVAITAVLFSSAYLAVTYPRVLIDFNVSFTVGADVKSLKLEVPFLHDHVTVEVFVNSGAALWTAKISSGNANLWSHTASQSGQTVYKSEWIKMPSGHYNFTFATAGIGSLEAEIKLTSKGEFW